jgi:hypothetical protein
VQTERDREIVDWISRLGGAGAEQVARRFGMGRSRGYARLGQLVADGLLEHRQLLHRQPGLYLATAEGLRWCGLQRLGVHRVGPGGFEHAWQLATAAVALHEQLFAWRILGEREIRAEENDSDELLASVKLGELPDGRAALHRPDLALISPEGRVVAVEVELSIKSRRRLPAICRGYARARQIDRVYYLATPAPARAVARAMGEVRGEDRISVLPLDQVGRLRELEEAGRVDV